MLQGLPWFFDFPLFGIAKPGQHWSWRTSNCELPMESVVERSVPKSVATGIWDSGTAALPSVAPWETHFVVFVPVVCEGVSGLLIGRVDKGQKLIRFCAMLDSHDLFPGIVDRSTSIRSTVLSRCSRKCSSVSVNNEPNMSAESGRSVDVAPTEFDRISAIYRRRSY